MESFSPASCSVDGGEDLLIIGSNISAQSRVVFMEKGPGEITLCYINYIKCGFTSHQLPRI